MRQAAAEISKSVSDLSDLISKLDKEVAERTGLGTYEQESWRPSSSRQPSSGCRTRRPAASERYLQWCWHPPSERVAMLTPGRIKPAMPFLEAKGLLPLPAQGRRVLTFGEKTQYGSQSKGLVLETRQAAQVVSPTRRLDRLRRRVPQLRPALDH